MVISTSSPIIIVSSRCLDSTSILGSFLGHAEAFDHSAKAETFDRVGFAPAEHRLHSGVDRPLPRRFVRRSSMVPDPTRYSDHP